MFRISDTIRRTKTADGGILLDIHHGQMFCLNVVGAKILDLLDAGMGDEQIAAEISQAYAMDIETVRADIREFIESLNRNHILQVRSESEPG